MMNAARAARSLPAWLVLAGLLLVAGNLRAAITTVGPLVPDMERDLGLSSMAASILVSLPLLAFAVVSPFAPRVAQRLGLERTVGLGLGVLAVGLVVRSLPPMPLLGVGTALIGVAIAVLNVLLPALVKRDFPDRIGQVTGAYSAVQGIFAAIAAGVAVPIAAATALGWRLPLGMWAGLALIALGVLAPQLRRGPATAVVAAASVVAAERSGPSGGVSSAPRSPWGRALAWQVTVFMGLQSVVYYIFVTWLPSIETAAGFSEAEAGMHLLVVNALGIVGSLTASALIPRMRDQRALAVGGAALMFVGSAGFLFAPAGGLAWSGIVGFAGGASIVLALSFFGLRTRDHSQAASLSGMAQCLGYVLAAIGPVAAGGLHDAAGSWAPALIVLMAVSVAVAVSGWLAGRSHTL
ncbi:CynX/NimT family MFS transporter [Microbacterium halophytorum]|uniref:CynX/NimT family MFS transporter n=1 Tax=Microbacterium halophytorum TaxID=2067568 RepID=UPI000CFCEE2B|nr:MFS transporter [Microbacterium halophytorum]